VTRPRSPWSVVLAAALLAATAARAEDANDTPAAPVRPLPRSSAWSTSAAVGLGPLGQGSGSPASVFRLVQTPTAPATLDNGQWELLSQTDWANYFCNGGERFLLDYEALRLRLGVAYGLTARTQIGLGSLVSYQGGGILDGFVEWFERSIGAVNRDRIEAPRGRYLVRTRGQDGANHESGGEESGWRLDSLALGVKHQLLAGSATTPALVATAVVKLPGRSGVPGRPAGGVDLGGSLAGGQRLGRFNLYGALGAVVFGKTELDGVELLRSQLSIMGAVEYRATPRTSFLAQGLVSSPVARHAGEFSERTREISIGLKHRVGRQIVLEFSVAENLLVFGNSADVAFHAGLSWRS
jgi:hypothetical protein